MSEMRTGDYLRLRLGTRQYALPLEGVLRVVAGSTRAPVPNDRRWLWGVVYDQGCLYPAVDLAGCGGEAAVAVLYAQDGLAAAFLADEAQELIRLDTAALAEGQPVDAGLRLGELWLPDPERVVQLGHDRLD